MKHAIRLLCVLLFLATASFAQDSGAGCSISFQAPLVTGTSIGLRHVGDPSGITLRVTGLVANNSGSRLLIQHESGTLITDVSLTADKNGEYHLNNDQTPIPSDYNRVGNYMIGVQTGLLFVTCGQFRIEPVPPSPTLPTVPPTPTSPPLPTVPAISQVNIYPATVVTAYVDEPVTFNVEVITGTGQRTSNLNSVPVGWITSGSARVEGSCNMALGVCQIRGKELGETQFTITSQDGYWGYRWVIINFIPRPTTSGFNRQLDNLPVTFNTNQAVVGDPPSGTITFTKNYPGEAQLTVWVDGKTKYFWFPNGIKLGDRQVVFSRTLSPMEERYTVVSAELHTFPGNVLVAKGDGQLSPWKNFGINFDEDTKTLKITDLYGDRFADYRVFLTRGQGFVLELPVAKFNLPRGVELVFYDGMFGSALNLPGGRYTVTLEIRDSRSGYTYPRTEANGLVINDGVRWR